MKGVFSSACPRLPGAICSWQMSNSSPQAFGRGHCCAVHVHAAALRGHEEVSSLRFQLFAQQTLNAECLSRLGEQAEPACTSQARLPACSQSPLVGISQRGRRHRAWKPPHSAPPFPCFLSSPSPLLCFLPYLSLINSCVKNQAAWERCRVLHRVSFIWACGVWDIWDS